MFRRDRFETITIVCLALLAGGTSVVHAVADGCAVVTATKDGFVSLREGPGTHYREIMQLRGGQFIGIDDLEGDPRREWWHVNALMNRTSASDLNTVRVVDGWAFARYLHPVNCAVDRPPPVKQGSPRPDVPPYRPPPSPPRYDPLPRTWEAPPLLAPLNPPAVVFQHGILRSRTAYLAEAPFKVVTTSGANYFFKLVRRYTGDEELAGFIVGGSPLETKVTPGSYDLRYASGDTWISEEEFFGPNTAFAKAESPLTFSIDGAQTRGVEVQLILQRGGNLKTSPIKRSEF